MIGRWKLIVLYNAVLNQNYMLRTKNLDFTNFYNRAHIPTRVVLLINPDVSSCPLTVLLYNFGECDDSWISVTWWLYSWYIGIIGHTERVTTESCRCSLKKVDKQLLKYSFRTYKRDISLWYRVFISSVWRLVFISLFLKMISGSV